MEPCPCYDRDFDKCPYTGAVINIEIKGFKGEPLEYIKRCDYQLYIGQENIIMSKFTREEYNQMQKNNTFCTY